MLIRIITILLLLISTHAFADMSKEEHIQSAFMFAKKNDWYEAVQHAKLAHSEILVKYFTWEYVKDPESEASFEAITEFLDDNPDFPDRNALEKRAEVAFIVANPSDKEIAEWFSKRPPQTNFVKIKIAQNPEELKKLVRNSWANDNYDKKTEEKLLEKYHSSLRESDHVARIDRLLWEGKIDEAKRILKFISPDYQKLFLARISLVEGKLFAPISVMRVPSRLKSNAGLIYERIKWRVHHDDEDGVREMLLAAPATLPYPEKWWGLFDRYVRKAIDDGNIALAERLLNKSGQKSGTPSYKDAEWLKGWIELEFKESPESARKIFTQVFEQSETPVGKGKAAYWLARAEEKISKGNPARWYGEAAKYPTTFYGQLAKWELNKKANNSQEYSINASDTPSSSEKREFDKKELVQLVYVLAGAGEESAAGRFIYYLTQTAKTPSEMILAADLGREIKRPEFSVIAAKKALQKDVVALDSGYPVIKLASSELDKALVLGLIRQESEFYSDAISGSGAEGLMQLLPATAKETARKADLSYGNLFEPHYNTLIGSLYLKKLVEKFDGSYVLAIAGYNAGPGRVKQWLSSFGEPTRDLRTAVDWIEKIPTNETRNYVQHVLENVQVYRYLNNGKKPVSDVGIGDDLVR